MTLPGRPARADEVRDTDESWPVTSSTSLYDGTWVVSLREDTLSAPDAPDEQLRRTVLEHPGAVVVLALDDEDRVLCLRQYRHVVGGRLLELPAGLRDLAGEEPLDVARRELVEETEVQAEHWEHLLTLWPSPGISEETQHVYLATGLSAASRGDFVPEHEEARLEVVWVPAEDLVDAVLAHEVKDGPLAAAILAWSVRRHRAARG